LGSLGLTTAVAHVFSAKSGDKYRNISEAAWSICDFTIFIVLKNFLYTVGPSEKLPKIICS
jgi:hypothetical protein